MATFNFAHPEKFDFAKPEQWEKWFKRFERFRQASGLCEKDEEMQVNTLLYSMGQESEDIIASFGLSEENSKKWDIVKDRFKQHFVPKKNVIFERAKFNQRLQMEGENVDSFITDLYHLAENCDFKDLHDELIRDRIVVGLRDHRLSERLQLDPGLTLEKAITEARQREAVRAQQGIVRGSNLGTGLGNVEAVRSHKKTAVRQQPTHDNNKSRHTSTGYGNECQRCGFRPGHPRNRCPANEATCNNCGKIGHFKKKCHPTVGEVGFQDDMYTDDSDTDSFLGTVRTQTTKAWTTRISVGDEVINFKIDTGADVTCISDTQLKKLRNVKIGKTKRKLFSASNKQMEVMGKFECVLESNSKMCVEEIYVVRDLESALLGRPAIAALEIIQVNNYIVSSVDSLYDQVCDRFPKMFEGIGKQNGNIK